MSGSKEAREQLRTKFYARVDRGVVTPQEAVRTLRQISGLTQPKFAARLKVSLVSLKAIERGKANPTQSTLERILVIGGLTTSVARISTIEAGVVPPDTVSSRTPG
jgi:transcriptional regulator with XRE-family HTH domain